MISQETFVITLTGPNLSIKYHKHYALCNILEQGKVDAKTLTDSYT